MLHPHFKSATDNTFYTARGPSLTTTVCLKMIDQSIHFYVGLRQSLHFNAEYCGMEIATERKKSNLRFAEMQMRKIKADQTV